VATSLHLNRSAIPNHRGEQRCSCSSKKNKGALFILKVQVHKAIRWNSFLFSSGNKPTREQAQKIELFGYNTLFFFSRVATTRYHMMPFIPRIVSVKKYMVFRIPNIEGLCFRMIL
jgi:hypothetical protein